MDWNLLFVAISTLAVFITMLLIIPQLRVIAKAQRLAGAIEFLNKIHETREARKCIFQELPTDKDKLSELPSHVQESAEKIINSFNEIAFLLEECLVPKKQIFHTCHSVFIRCWYKLKPYAKYQEQMIGSRYARRVALLDKRAKLYHDIYPQHRITKIKFYQSSQDKSIVIYETKFKKGWMGFLQRISRFFRRIFQIY